LNFICTGGGKGSCLASDEPKGDSVTNPFMVTRTFIFFVGIEPILKQMPRGGSN
jgi:hypothetical protein